MDLQFDNCWPATNGEYNLIDHAASHWLTAIDAGANVGDWTAHLLSVNAECQVACVEPSPTVCDKLRERFAPLPNVAVQQWAISDRAGRVTLYEHEATEMSGILKRPGFVYKGTTEVATVTLDELLMGDSVDFVKVDTEGSEPAVFRGARESMLAGRIGAVQFEYGGTWNESLATVCAWLEGIGWNCYLIQPTCLVRMPAAEDHGHYCNILTVPDPGLLEFWGMEVLVP
jgi:FkbM family methyltransferase